MKEKPTTVTGVLSGVAILGVMVAIMALPLYTQTLSTYSTSTST